jgi:two-component system CheB/CheR fusion protein
VLRLAREELRLELRYALRAAFERRERSRSEPISLEREGRTRHVVLHVQPAEDEELAGLCLVPFDELPDRPHAASGDALATEESAALQVTQRRLHEVIQQYERSQDEMRAANDALHSTNEELRSAIEELETSKDELQSMNEQLQTVNEEIRHKVDELSQMTRDLNNLMGATEIATLFLDRALRILRITPCVSELFNVRSGDLGRPLTDLTHRLGYGDLPRDARQVLDRLVPIERKVCSESGSWYLVRILPYRSLADCIEGVVITFVDISERKSAELALRSSEAVSRALVSASAQIVWTMDREGQTVDDSPSWRGFTGQS